MSWNTIDPQDHTTLPPKGEQVDIWVTGHNAPGGRIINARQIDGEWQDQHGDWIDSDYTLGGTITHWMPRPTPPEGGLWVPPSMRGR